MRVPVFFKKPSCSCILVQYICTLFQQKTLLRFVVVATMEPLVGADFLSIDRTVGCSSCYVAIPTTWTASCWLATGASAWARVVVWAFDNLFNQTVQRFKTQPTNGIQCQFVGDGYFVTQKAVSISDVANDCRWEDCSNNKSNHNARKKQNVVHKATTVQSLHQGVAKRCVKQREHYHQCASHLYASANGRCRLIESYSQRQKESRNFPKPFGSAVVRLDTKGQIQHNHRDYQQAIPYTAVHKGITLLPSAPTRYQPTQ